MGIFLIRSFLLLLALAPAALAAGPRRIASLLPSHTEIVVALGAESSLVGVSDAEREGGFPGLSRVGGVAPNWEALVGLAPDLVLADSAHERYRADFVRFHIPVKFLPATHARNPEDVLLLIEGLGDAIGRSAEARRLGASLRSDLAALDAAGPSGPSPTAFFEIWPHPLQAAGSSSLQGNLLKRAGFANIVPDTRNEMPLVSAEWVASERPEWIFYTSDSSLKEISSRPGWATIPAVRDGRVIRLDGDLFSRAGPRVVEALKELARIRREAK
jgi:iron complex transport system substrate-binding protein